MTNGQRPLMQRLETRINFEAGDLDTSFSGDGRASFQINNSIFSGGVSAVQSDGSVVVTGSDSSAGGLPGSLLARYLPDGTRDTAFGGAANGIVSIDFASRSENISDIRIQADGRIVVVGTTRTSSGTARGFVARLVAGGALDPSFSGDGLESDLIFETNPSNDVIVYDSIFTSLAIQNDGKLVVGGSSYVLIAGTFGNESTTLAGAIRLNANGTRDTTFDGDGGRYVDMGDEHSIAKVLIDYSGGSVGANPNFGKITLAGSMYSNNLGIRQFAIARLTVGGTLDNGFSGDGIFTGTFGAGYVYNDLAAAVFQGDGKLVVAANVDTSATFSNGLDRIGVFRLNANGTGDSSFGAGNGQTVIDYLGDDIAADMTIGQQGDLFIAGGADSATPQARVATLTCLNPNGTLDLDFSGDGKATYDLPVGSSGAVSISRTLTGGKLVMGGGRGFNVLRVADRAAATVSISVDGDIYEQGPTSTTLRVKRLEALPTVTRVYLDFTGTATKPNTVAPVRPADYTGSANISFGDGLTSFTYVDIPAGATEVAVTLTAVNDTLIEGDELANVAIFASTSFDRGNARAAQFVVLDNDVTTGPSVLTGGFGFFSSPHAVTFRFNQYVFPSLSLADFVFSANLPLSRALTYDTATNTATITFGSIVPDGSHSVRAVASGIRNGANLPMGADYTVNFSFRRGDMDYSGVVNNADIAPFVMGLTDPAGFEAYFGYPANVLGDMNNDGQFNNADIAPFVARLTGGRPTNNASSSLGRASRSDDDTRIAADLFAA